MKICDNCRTAIDPGTGHKPVIDYAGGGICEVRPEWTCKYCDGVGRHAVGCRCKSKPHLRLHYNPTPMNAASTGHWWVEYASGSFRHSRDRTYMFTTAAKAVRAAGVYWFGVPLGRYA